MLVCFSLRLLAEGGEAGNVLADYVEFDIDLRADAESAEVGMLVCVGDDSHAEAARTAVADRKTDAVDRHRPLFDRYISLRRHIVRHGILKRVVSAAVHTLYVCAYGCRIYVSLNNMSVQTIGQAH